MSYDGKIMRQALARFEEDKQRRAAEFARRRDRLYETEPRLKEIEQQLRATMPKLIASALRRGADPLPAVRVLQDENLDLQRQRMQLLTLVPHNAAIFKGTVEANLRMAKPDAAEEQLWAALEQVNLADFCRSQNGLATALHEGGSNLSGGQRQRLAMARALLHDSPIYVFDEATSNVDAESENDIMKAVHSLAGHKTVILISHRLANVVKSDCIYVMDKGRIAQQGTHAELLAADGPYSRLYNAQKQLETLGEVSA